MGKDREGKYHPGKGRPSGMGKDNEKELHLTEENALENYLEIADKYTEGEEEVPANVKVRHPNRNVDKGAERQPDRAELRRSKSNKSQNQTFSEGRTQTTPEEIPGTLTKELFASLAAFTADVCISVYMNTHPVGAEVNEQVDLIRFKNHLQGIANTLRERGETQTRIHNLLEPGYDLLRNEDFWKNPGKGLVFFIADNHWKYVRLPKAPIEEEVFINKSFYLKPLVPFMTSREYFYLLVISKKQCKFFRGDAFGLEYLHIAELPAGVDDVVHFEEKESQKLFRTDTNGAGEGANFHGMGAGKPDEKKHLAVYLEEVDDTLWQEVLHKENVPLLLAGVEYLIPIYKSVTDYNNIWPEAITGSHEHDDLNTLHQLTMEKMQSYFEERTSKALQNYFNQSATALSSSNEPEVISAAHYGRVAHLFVEKDQHIWGTFDELKNETVIHEERQENDECLLDKAVIKTLLTGGDVHLLERDKMPAARIAALMRY